jgi:hypothetical protein
MISILAAVVNAANILLCIGMVVYSIKWLRLFRGGIMHRGLEVLVVSVSFFLIAAIARAALVWDIFPAELEYVDISVRSIAFVFLFSAIVLIVHTWSSLGNKA